MPLAGACGTPLKFLSGPARQPTAAATLPPLLPKLSAGWTATLVTTLAKKQFGFEESPWQSPVGRLTFSNVRPASSERYRPKPVAAYMRFGLVGSTAALKPSAPSGTPLA